MIQVKIFDRENRLEHGGIITDNGNIICGCCGGLIEKDEISIKHCSEQNLKRISKFDYDKNNEDNCTTEITEVFEAWIDLSEAIIGD